jgi:putative transposase
MSLRPHSQPDSSCFFITTTFRDHTPFGEIEGFYSALTDSLSFCTEKYHAAIVGYCLMPSHIHFVVFIEGRFLGGFMRDFKKFIAQKAARELGIRDSQIWMPRYDRKEILSEEMLRQKIQYMHSNPVKAGLVVEEHTWQWSSAADYAGVRLGPITLWKDWR